jgi:hypothetical protein
MISLVPGRPMPCHGQGYGRGSVAGRRVGGVQRHKQGRTKTGENASEAKELPAIRSLDSPVATVAFEKSDSRDDGRPAGRSASPCENPHEIHPQEVKKIRRPF